MEPGQEKRTDRISQNERAGHQKARAQKVLAHPKKKPKVEAQKTPKGSGLFFRSRTSKNFGICDDSAPTTGVKGSQLMGLKLPAQQ